MALRSEVVYLVGLRDLHHPGQRHRIRHVAVMQDQAPAVDVGVLIEVVDTLGVEKRRAALDAVHLVTLLEQELGEISAILARDAGNQRCLMPHSRESVPCITTSSTCSPQRAAPPGRARPLHRVRSLRAPPCRDNLPYCVRGSTYALRREST